MAADSACSTGRNYRVDLLNDGRWHRLTLALQTNRIELHLDGVPSITKRLFSMETGIEYLVGGSYAPPLLFLAACVLMLVPWTLVRVSR
ncbi:hypothetical protein HPB48_012771 [Haemaphysalis longicornis]|uniref:Laminin G domain-containing protein n=1 Tax=Haemaphysalis longicornis TaxID=44386 RepID=A0A9J6FSF2_HAELO|nr:hypothetical protein HPB48_012771 [Haemaphysalis longicornis]